MELTGPVPLGAAAAIAAQVQPRKPIDVQKVDPGRQSDSAGTDARQRPEQEQTAASARDITDLRHKARQRDLPAGPSPAFEVSLLEMESDLKQVIARIESARSQERDAQAVKAPAEAEAARLKAEMAAKAADAADAKASSQTEIAAAAASEAVTQTVSAVSQMVQEPKTTPEAATEHAAPHTDPGAPPV